MSDRTGQDECSPDLSLQQYNNTSFPNKCYFRCPPAIWPPKRVPCLWLTYIHKSSQLDKRFWRQWEIALTRVQYPEAHQWLLDTRLRFLEAPCFCTVGSCSVHQSKGSGVSTLFLLKYIKLDLRKTLPLTGYNLLRWRCISTLSALHRYTSCP